MLTARQIKLLQLLDQKVKNCKECSIHSNGKSIPQWTNESKYIIIGEAPTYSDIRKKKFFTGKAGSILGQLLDKTSIKPKEILLINSIQCYNHGKPSVDQLYACHEILRKYIRVLNPEKILCLGNYAKHIFTETTMGVMSLRKEFRNYSFGDNIEYPVLFTINPAYCIYNEEEGLQILKEDIKIFSETKFESHIDWLLSVDDFII